MVLRFHTLERDSRHELDARQRFLCVAGLWLLRSALGGFHGQRSPPLHVDYGGMHPLDPARAGTGGALRWRVLEPVPHFGRPLQDDLRSRLRRRRCIFQPRVGEERAYPG
jgi:hypothetical protein